MNALIMKNREVYGKMMSYSKTELQEASQLISSTINKCIKMQPKFMIGTSQHSLLVNRIKALQISKSLIENDYQEQYSFSDLEKALPPIQSIINKTQKAQRKYEKDMTMYKRLEPMIKAMTIAKSLLEAELKRNII